MLSSEISTRHQVQTTTTSSLSGSLTTSESSPYDCRFAPKTKKIARYSFVGWSSTQHRNSRSKLFGTQEIFGPFSRWKTKWRIDHAASMKELVHVVCSTSVKRTGWPIFAGMNIPPLPQKVRTPPNTSMTTPDHFFSWRILTPAPKKFLRRRILESYYIAKFKPKINIQATPRQLFLFRNGITWMILCEYQHAYGFLSFIFLSFLPFSIFYILDITFSLYE